MADLGTVTITEETMDYVKKIKFEWTTEDGGDNAGKASKTTEKTYTGQIVRLVTIPGAAPNAPTDDYDIVINDEDETDVLMGAGANRDTADTEQVLASLLGYVANDKLTLNVSSAGNAKKGTTIVYIR